MKTMTEALQKLINTNIEISLDLTISTPTPTPDKRGVMLVTGPMNLGGKLLEVGEGDDSPCCLLVNGPQGTAKLYFRPRDTLLITALGDIAIADAGVMNKLKLC